MNKFTKSLAIASALTFGAAFLSQRAAGPKVRQTYEELDKPAWAPPAWVFGPVWTLLYASLSVATALAASSNGGAAGSRKQTATFAAHLAANAAWAPLFFRFRRYELAELDSAVTTLLVLLLSVSYGSRSRAAAVTLLPLAGWCTFATLLTRAIRLRIS